MLSAATTYQGGALSAAGGPQGGDGGTVEISGQGGLSLSGKVDVGARNGRAGTVLIDPLDLSIEPDGTVGQSNTLVTAGGLPFDVANQTASAIITPQAFAGLTGTVVLQASRDLVVDTSFSYAATQLSLQAGRDLTVNTGVTIAPAATGVSLALGAATPGFARSTAAGTLALNGAVSADALLGQLSLQAGTGGILLNAPIGGATVRLVTPGAVTQTGGVITAGTVSADLGSVTGPLAGAISTLGSVSVASGALALTSTTAITLAGPVSADTVSIAAPSASQQGGSYVSAIQVTGTVVATGGITLTADDDGSAATPGIGSLIATPIAIANGATLRAATVTLASLSSDITGGAVSQAGGSAIQAGTLTGTVNSGTVDLRVAGNTITTLGDFAAAAGAIPFLGVAAHDLHVSGRIAAGTLDLSTIGDLTQTGGTIAAGLLQSSAGIGGAASLVQPGNRIGTLGTLAIDGGTLSLRSDQALSIGGPVSAAGASILLGAPGATLTLGQPFQVVAGGTLSLQADAFSLGGTVALNTARTGLTEIASTSAEKLAMSAGAGTLDVSGVLHAVNAATLHLGAIGPAAPTATGIGLATFDLTEAGHGAQTLWLSAAGDITQSGPLAVAGLVGGATGAITLANALNAIGTIGGQGLSAAHIGLADSSALVVAGPVALTGAGTISIAADRFSFAGGGALNAGSGLAELGPLAGTVVQIGTAATGGIAPGDFSLIAAGTLRLGETALSPVKSTGIAFLGSAALAAGTTLELDTAGGVSQSGGSLQAGTLTGSVGTSVTLSGANAIAALGRLTGGAGIAITNATSLAVTGLVTAGADTGISLAAPGIALTGAGGLLVPDTAGGGLVALRADTVTLQGPITNPGGGVALAPVSAGGTLTLGGAGATQADLVAPRVTLGSLDGVATIAGGIDITGPGLNLSGAGLALFSAGPVSQERGAVLTAGTLSGSVGALAFTEANTVATLADLHANSGGIAFADAGTLVVAGPVSLAASGQTLALTAASLTVTANAADTLKAPSGTIVLAADNFTFPTTPVAALIDAGTGAVALQPRGANVAMRLGLGGAAALAADTIELGGFQGAPRAASLALGGLSVAGNLTLESLGVITQQSLPSAGLSVAPGTSSAGVLSVQAGDATSLANAANAVGLVGNVAVGGGDFTFADQSAPVFGGTVAASHIALGSASGMTLAGTLDATTSLSLAATGITETAAATIHTPRLAATGGSIDLSSGANTISGVGNVTAGTSFTLIDTIDPAIAGPVDAPVTLIRNTGIGNNGIGGITIAGSITATTALTLQANGGSIAEQGAGTLQVGSLAGSLAGGGNFSLLGAGNAVAAADIADSGGSVALLDGHGLALGGVVADRVAITDTGGGITLVHAVSGTTRVALVTDALAVAGGSISGGSVVEIAPYGATTVSLGAGGGLLLAPATLAAITTPLLRIGAAFGTTLAGEVDVAGTVSINAGSALELAALNRIAIGGIAAARLDAPVSTALLAPAGHVDEFASSVLDTPFLTGQARAALLASPLNTVGTLAGFDVGGGSFTLADAAPLMQTGTLSGGLVTLRALSAAPTSLALTGTIAAGTLDLSAAGGIAQTAGALTATTLQSSFGVSGAVSLDQGGNQVTNLATFNAAAARFSLHDSVPLTQSGTLTAGTVTLTDTATTAPSLTLTGSLVTGTLDLNAAAGVVQNGGGIAAGTLQSSTGVSGDVTLAQGGNAIATLGTFNDAAGRFTLHDAAALTQRGTLTAGTATLGDSFATAPSLTLAGTILVGTLDLGAANGIIQTGGSVAAATLQSSSGVMGSASLAQPGNAIAAIATFNVGAGSFTLQDTVGLTQTGTLTAGTATLADGFGAAGSPAPSLILAGSIIAGTLDLGAAGAVTQPAGIITAGTLQSSAGVAGDVSLTQAGNAIATLATFNDGAARFTLQDGAALTQTGTLAAGSVLLGDSAATGPSLTLAGTILTGTLDLAAAAGLTQAAGAIAATTLQSSAGVAGDVSLAQSGNRISTLAGFDAGTGRFILQDASALTLTGTLVAGSLDLGAAGLTQTAGAVTAGILQSSAGVTGDVALTQPGNAIATLATFNDGAARFTLQDSARLTQTGTLTAGVATLRDSAATGPSLILSGTIVAGTLDLGAANGVTQTGGRIVADILQSSGGVTGDVSLAQPGNAITTLATFSTGAANFTLQDTAALTQTGTLTAATATLTDLAATPQGLVLAGSIEVGTLDLTAATAVIQTGGAITAETLRSGGGVGGTASLSGSGNAIAQLTGFTAGSFALADSAPLTQSGTLAAAAIALNDTATSAPSLTLQGTLVAGTLDLDAAAGVRQSAGSITAGTLQSSLGVTGDVNLGQAANAIATLATFNDAASGFTLRDAASLTQTGTLTAATALIAANGATTPSLTLEGTILVGTLDLGAANGIAQTGGLIAAAILQSSAGVAGPVTLAQPGNRVAQLATFDDTTGGFTLKDGAALLQTGTLTAATISLAASAALTLGGTLAGATGIDLSASAAGVAQRPDSVLATSLLTGSAGGGANVSLSGTANLVRSVGGFSVPGGSFALADATDPRIIGPVSAASISLTDTGLAGITVGGAVSGTASVSLNTLGGGIREATGIIATPLLLSDGGIVGDAVLTGAGNAILTLGRLAVTGALQVTQTGALIAAGPVSATQGIAIATSGGLTVAGDIAAPGQAVTLSAGGAIDQTGGIVSAGTLAAIGANIALLSPGNRIDSLATIASRGPVGIETAVPLVVEGPVSGTAVSIAADGSASTLAVAGAIDGAEGITLQAGGGLALRGAIATPGTLTLGSATQSVLQDGGTAAAGTLAAEAAADILLEAAGNRIDTLGSVAAGGRLAVADASALRVSGPVQSATARLSTDGGLTFDGTLTAGTLDLETRSGGVSQTGGTLVLDTLAGGIVGDARLDGTANRIAALGGLTVGSGSLTLKDNTDLAVAGALAAANISLATPGSVSLAGVITTGTLTLQTGGPVLRPAGAGGLVVGVLAGQIADLADFGASSQIDTVGPLTVTGDAGRLVIANAVPLAVAGPLDVASIAVTASRLITLTGTITTTGVGLQAQAAAAKPLAPGSSFAVTANAGGAAIRQTGTLLLQPSPGAAAATVRLNLPAGGGTIVLDNLYGPRSNLILDMGSTGTAKGVLTVANLRLIGVQGSTALFGTVSDTAGPEAARRATVSPRPAATYRLNGCPIGSVNCVLLPIGLVPLTNPLRDVALDLRRDNGGDDLALPDVSSQDY